LGKGVAVETIVHGELILDGAATHLLSAARLI
jgi:hypothetical protein